MKDFPSEDLPGDYSEIADAIVHATNADAVVVIVLGGEHGNGACPLLKMNGATPLGELKALMVAALRAMANGLEGIPLPVPAECAVNARTPRGAAN